MKAKHVGGNWRHVETCFVCLSHAWAIYIIQFRKFWRLFKSMNYFYISFVMFSSALLNINEEYMK
jgi:hypothetical protein